MLLDTGDDDVVLDPVTSRPRLSEYDVPLVDWRSANLNVACTVRVHKLGVVAKQAVPRRIGVLSARDFDTVFSVTAWAFRAG